MRKLILLAALLPVLAQAYAVTAYFTGRSQFVTTVGGGGGISCEYNAAGTVFWRTFSGLTCPFSIEVY